jgi:cobalt-zinc-cadmium efflux system membrane fusion protein
MKSFLPFGCAPGLLALVAWSGCARPAPPVAEPGPKVEGAHITYPAGAPQLASLTIETAQPRRLAVSHLTGRLYWSDDSTVRIFTPVMGRVTAIRADLGQKVAAGAPLAEISSPDYGQALADARAGAANFVAAGKTYARAQDLFAHGASAQKDVESAEAAYRAAGAERDRAAARLRLYGGSVTESGDTYILRSPVAGVVVSRNLNPGQEVRNDQMLANAPSLFAPLFVVGNPAQLWLQLDAAESDLASLAPGQQLLVTTRAFPGETFHGAIQSIAAEMDPATRTIKVRGVVQNPDLRLKAEMYVMVDVLRDESQVAGAGVTIPAKAVFTVENQPYLFVELAPGRFERRRIEIGTESDGRVPVLQGVAAGERVVAEGGLLLQAVLDPTG